MLISDEEKENDYIMFFLYEAISKISYTPAW